MKYVQELEIAAGGVLACVTFCDVCAFELNTDERQRKSKRIRAYRNDVGWQPLILLDLCYRCAETIFDENAGND